MNRYVRTSAKILLWLIGIVIVLIGLVFILIHEPFVHNIARKKVVNFLEERLKTDVEIQKLSLDFPKKLVLEGVYFEDQQGDTLLAGDTIKVDLHMWKLLGNEVVINEVDLRGITAYVNRTTRDSLYNFDYIIRAFAREEEKSEVDSNAAMKFSLSKINFDRIRMKFDDEMTGKAATVYLKHFDTNITEFDLDNRRFTIPKITLDGIVGSVHQDKAISAELLTPDTLIETPTFLWPDINIGEILISDIHLDYDNVVSAVNSNVDLEDLQIKFDKLDLKNQNVDVRSIQLSNTSGSFALGDRAQQAVEATAEEVADEVKKGWSIQLDELDFENIDFKYDDLNSREITHGIDYKHLDVADLTTKIKDILYTGDTIAAKVQELTVTESSGINIQRFHADIFYDEKKTHVDNLLLETPNSIVRDQIRITYPSVEAIRKDIGLVGIDAQLIKNRISVSDLLLMVPELSRKPFFRRNANAVILVDGYISGTVDDLSFSALDITGLGNTTVRASGTIRGLPDFERSHFDLNIAQFTTTANDLRAFIPAGNFPSGIRIPESISLRGRFHGSLSNFDANLAMNSSLGAARLDGTLKDLTRKGRESYNARIQFTQFDLGKFLRKEEKIGKVTLNVLVKGAGTDIKTANASIEGTVSEAHYNGYTYHNLILNGTAASGDLQVKASMADPNITFNIDGTANLNGQYPTLKGTIDIDTINLQQLKLHEKDIRFSGRIIADLPTADPDHLNGTIQLANSIITLEGKRYMLDTVSIVSVASDQGDSIDIVSEFMHFHAAGQYNLTQVVPAFQDQLNNYFNTNPGSDTTYNYNPQQIKFTLQLVRSPLIEQIFPELHEMEDARITGSFDSEKGEILIDGSMPRMRYKEFTLSNVNLDINTENNALNYAFGFEELNSSKFKVLKTAITGKAQNDVLDVDLVVHDAEDKPRYRITGDLNSKGNAFEFSLADQGLLLNYDQWNVAPSNTIAFGKQGIQINNFEISHNDQRLQINSVPPQFDAPLEIRFTDFKIETVTRLVTKDSLFAGGVVNGVATIKDMKDNLVFTSDLNIEDFSFHGDTVGNVALKVNNQTPNTYAAEVSITGDGNEVNLTGTYFDSGDKSNYNLDMNIKRLNLSSVEGFTAGEIDKGTGYLTGNLKITGSSLTPQVRGAVRFHDAAFNITKFNSYYRVDDEELNFTDKGLTLNSFTLIDSSGNEAVVDGHILTQDYKDFNLDLNVRADNFQVLNSTRDNNKLYYGRLFIDTRLKITGGLNNPAVDGTLRVKENTQLTVVIPQTDPGIVEREGIVEFVDMDTFEITYITGIPDSLVTSEVVGMDVAVNISIDREAELNLIIDEANGDYLRVKGQADLLGGIDPSGKVTLTGTYELEEGAYSFSFNQLKREFVIQKGSSITWTGEPMLADVNVTAVYTAETAPLSLVQNQLADADQSVINTYKQKLPFQIHLTMKGELLRPDIAFNIELPEKNYGVNSEIISTVNARLVQLRTEPSELNKQVFAVLLLNRFISDDPFKNEARGAGISTLARQSASKLLSEQLNAVLGGMIAGFDLNFDINSIEDYTTGELKNRTDLTIGVSKRLLDDRLNINIGSQFELEGPKDTNRKTTNIAGDVSAEYQLSKDGRYLVRAYRKNEYIVVQGQVVETGLGFVFTADYEKVKDLFAKKTEEQKIAKKEERNARKEERREGTE